MKLHTFKLIAFIALFMGSFSCTNDEDEPEGFQWDYSKQQEEYRPINLGEESSSFKIDDNIISFAVPYLVGTSVSEYPPEPSWGSQEGFSPHIWIIRLIMPKGTDVTKLTPVVTLAHGATLAVIEGIDYPSKYVEYTGIVEVVEYSFKNQIDFTVHTSDGKTAIYKFFIIVIGTVYPCIGCP